MGRPRLLIPSFVSLLPGKGCSGHTPRSAYPNDQTRNSQSLFKVWFRVFVFEYIELGITNNKYLESSGSGAWKKVHLADQYLPFDPELALICVQLQRQGLWVRLKSPIPEPRFCKQSIPEVRVASRCSKPRPENKQDLVRRKHWPQSFCSCPALGNRDANVGGLNPIPLLQHKRFQVPPRMGSTCKELKGQLPNNQ